MSDTRIIIIQTGAKGDAATFELASINTGAAGSNATITETPESTLLVENIF
ncbi:MAG: hypothetical protein LBH34_01400 [Prevotellaceae bacterium]|nr:hypothetical protein [Prevotellaceae bacterium]